jgi:hypothetical protein
MTVALKSPPIEPPEAGVIEEARRRQRRGRAAAAIAAASAVAALLVSLGGGGSGPHARSASGVSRRLPAGVRQHELASCAGKDLNGPPSASLLSILGVLRRRQIATDIGSGITGGGVIRDVFVDYIRRTRVVSGSSYYLYPAILGGCGTGERPHQGIMDRTSHVNLGAGIIGGVGGGGYTAAEIKHGLAVETGPPSSATSETVTLIVPDGVANVTLRYPAGPASGYSRSISPAFSVTGSAIGDEVVLAVPRSGGPEDISGIRMIWRGPDGRLLKRFDRL